MAGLATSQPSRLACSCNRRGEPVIPGVEADFHQVVGEHVLTSNPSNIVGHSKPLHGEKSENIFHPSNIQTKDCAFKSKWPMSKQKFLWPPVQEALAGWPWIKATHTQADECLILQHSSSKNCLCWIKKTKGSRLGWWPQQWITKLMRLKVPWGGSSLSSWVTLLKDVK